MTQKFQNFKNFQRHYSDIRHEIKEKSGKCPEMSGKCPEMSEKWIDLKNVSRHSGGHYNIKIKHFEHFSLTHVK